MILQSRKFILSSLGFLLLALFGQPLWTALHGTLAKLPPRTRPFTTASAPVGDVPSKSSLASIHSYGQLPIYFEPNVGQTDSQVKFIARGSGATAFLTATEAVFSLPAARHSRDNGNPALPVIPAEEVIGMPVVGFGLSRGLGLGVTSFNPTRSKIHSPQLATANRQLAITMKLVGANPSAQIEGVDRLPRISNYFIGNDPKKWRTNIPNYSRVRYRDIYPGIDLVYYGNPDQLEYDVVVAPGVDPQSFLIAFEGADDLSINGNGDLVMEIAGAQILQHKPQVYQWFEGRQTSISAKYRINAEKHVAFSVGDHDVAQPIFIDPVLSFSFNFPGRGFGSGIVVDSSGSAYITGVAGSADFPTTVGAFQTTWKGEDAFVAKLNPRGTGLIYSTFLGGGATDTIAGVAIDQAGNAYVAGGTNSNDFPTTPGAFQPTYANGSVAFGPADAFVTKLNPTGTALVYSTYLGGRDDDGAGPIAVDPAGNAYTTGSTLSADFPVSPGFPNPPGAFQKSIGGSYDIFVTKLNPLGSALVYSTYLGGSDPDFSNGLRLNSLGEVYVAGTTTSVNFPVTAGAYQTTYQGGSWALGGGDTFATKLNASGTGLIYSTYIGSAAADRTAGLALDSQGMLYISGASNPLVSYPEGFVKILNSTGTQQAYSTHLAGGFPGTIEVDSGGNIHVLDSWALKKLNPRNDSILNTIPFGGFDPRLDITSFALNPAGDVYVTGWKSTGATISCGGGITSTFYQNQQAYVAKWTETEYATLFVPIVLSASGLNNSFFTSELTLTNTGPKDARLDFTYVAAFGDGSGSATTTLPAGKQQIFPDAIEYLRSLGLPTSATGNRGGALSIHVSGASSSSDVASMVRTATAAGAGRAGLAYPAISVSKALTDPVYLLGLRQNEADRSNVALQNAGGPADGNIGLRLTIFSGERANALSLALPDIQLGPGEFRQVNGILNSSGVALQNGYVRVEKLSGSAPYYAYGVINDQMSSDGSFVPPTPRFLAAGQDALWLPAVIESGQFDTEVIVTNWSTRRKVIPLSFQTEALVNEAKTAYVSVELEAGEQKIIPGFVQYLRTNGFGDVGPIGPTYVGTVMARDATMFRCNNLEGVSISARTSARGVGGNYGVFYSGVPQVDTLLFSSVWLYGLQQNSENRTNLALANTAFQNYTGQTTNEFKIELFDGDRGSRVSVIEGITLDAGKWRQFGSILAQYAPSTQQGYARVSRTKSGAPFIAYAVTNDGSTPGERTGDGAFITSSP
jgi:Beta-propeller repeat